MQLQTQKENISPLKQIIDVTSHSLTWLIYGERKIKVGECLNERKPTTLKITCERILDKYPWVFQ